MPSGTNDIEEIVLEEPYQPIYWLSTGKAAQRMGITTRTLYRFIDKGDLPAYRFGRVIRLQLQDVDTYISECRVTPGTLEHLYPEARDVGASEDVDDAGDDLSESESE